MLQHEGGGARSHRTHHTATTAAPPSWPQHAPARSAVAARLPGSGSIQSSIQSSSGRVLVHSTSTLFSPDGSSTSGARTSAAPSSTWASSQVPVNLRTERLLQQLQQQVGGGSVTERGAQRHSKKERKRRTGSAERTPNAAASSTAAPQAAASTARRPKPWHSNQQHSHAPPLQKVTLVSADDEWQVELPLEVACTSSAIRSMLHSGRSGGFSGGGSFLESREGVVRFPTIRAEMLREVAAFLTQQHREVTSTAALLSPTPSYRPLQGSSAASSVPALLELLMTAHFLDLAELMIHCARSLAPKFLELLPLVKSLPDEVLALILRQLPPQMLYVAERKLWKQQRSLPTRHLWHAMFERKFRGCKAPSTKVARRMCVQLFVENLAARYAVPVAAAAPAPTTATAAAAASTTSNGILSPGSAAAAAVAASSSAQAQLNSLALLSPRKAAAAAAHAASPADQLLAEEQVATAAAAAAAAASALLNLHNWASFLGPELRCFQMRNALLEAHLAELIPCFPNLRLLDLAGGGYEKQLGASLARGLKAVAPAMLPLSALDLARCNVGVEGLRALVTMMAEQYTAVQRRRGAAEREGSVESSPRTSPVTVSSSSSPLAATQVLPRLTTRSQSHASASSKPTPTESSSSSSPSPPLVPPLVLPSIGASSQQSQRPQLPFESKGGGSTSPRKPPSANDAAFLARSFHLSLPTALPSSTTVIPHSSSPATARHHASSNHSNHTSSFVSHLQRSLSSAALQHFMPIDSTSTSSNSNAAPSNGAESSRTARARAMDAAAVYDAETSFYPADAPSSTHRRSHRARRGGGAKESGSASETDSACAALDALVDSRGPGLEISLRDNALGDLGLMQLVSGWGAQMCWLRAIDLTGNSAIGERGAAVLAECIRRGHAAPLRHLNVSSCGLGSRGVAALADALRCAPAGCCSLELLDVRGNIKPAEENHATSALGSWLGSGDACSSSSSLQALALGDNCFPLAGLGSFLLSALPVAAAGPPSTARGLRTLDCSGVDMSSPSALALVQSLVGALCDAPGLRALSLSGNRMSCAATALFAPLLSNPACHLSSLDLGGNAIDAYTAAAFGAGLADNTELTALSLAGYTDGKRMRVEGCVALMRGLQHNRTLLSLDLSYHGLRNAGCAALCDVLAQTALRYVCLQRNHIAQRGALHLANCLQSLLSVPSRWYTAHSAQPALVFDLSHNAIDARAQASLHACVQQAALMAATMQQAATQQQQQQSQHQQPEPSSHTARSSVSTPAGASVSAASPRSALRFFRNDVVGGSSVWCHPSLRLPSQTAHCTPHIARQLQALGVYTHSSHPLLLPCAQQIVHDDDELTSSLVLAD